MDYEILVSINAKTVTIGSVVNDTRPLPVIILVLDPSLLGQFANAANEYRVSEKDAEVFLHFNAKGKVDVLASVDFIFQNKRYLVVGEAEVKPDMVNKFFELYRTTKQFAIIYTDFQVKEGLVKLPEDGCNQCLYLTHLSTKNPYSHSKLAAEGGIFLNHLK